MSQNTLNVCIFCKTNQSILQYELILEIILNEQKTLYVEESAFQSNKTSPERAHKMNSCSRFSRLSSARIK